MPDWSRTALTLLAAAALNVLVAVIAGAFGAHGLEERVTAERLAVFETGARYHVYGGLGMAIAAIVERLGLAGAARAGWVLQAGTVVFSGTLYLLVLLDQGWLGAITPLGGAAMMVGWALLAWAALRRRAAT